jgi:prevent-host-death family protein
LEPRNLQITPAFLLCPLVNIRSPVSRFEDRCAAAHYLDKQTRLNQTYLMRLVNIQAAKTHLSRLVEEAREGEDIVLAKAGRPMVRLVPVTAKGEGVRPSGQWSGKGFIADDFDAPCPEIAAMFFATEREGVTKTVKLKSKLKRKRAQ